MAGRRAATKRELYRLVIARSDVKAALETCDLLLKNVTSLSHELYEPLYFAVVISYSRPFTRNEPAGALKPRWRQFTNSALKEAHDRLLEARNKIVAHSDHRAVKIAPRGYPVPGFKGARFARTGVFVASTYYQVGWFKTVRAVCLDLGRRLDAECKSLLSELYDGRQLPPDAFLLTFDDDL